MRLLNRKPGWLLVSLALLAALIFLTSRFGLWTQAARNPMGGNQRQPEVLYLSPTDAPELWRVGIDGKNPVRLTTTDSKVYDYAVSLDGSHVAYSVDNAQNGRDLWEIGREGGKPRELLPCGTDWCQTPAYSPDGRQLAYSRRQYNGLGGEPGAPGMWSLDLSTLSTEMITSDARISASDPAWSPDGRYLSFVDTLSGGVRVIDYQQKKSFLIQAEAGVPAAWSPDSQKLLALRVEGALVEGAAAPGLTVYLVDVRTQQANPLPGAMDATIEYSLPDWSPDGQWLAAAERPFGGSGGKQLWVFRVDGSQRKAISEDPLLNDASYHWSPDGQKLVFQRLAMNDPGTKPKIMLWDKASGAVFQIAAEGFQPHWIP